MGPIYKYAVGGRGTFPADMLRHDCAWPADTLSALNILREDELREVHLFSRERPTGDRWRSFGWWIVDNEVRAL